MNNDWIPAQDLLHSLVNRDSKDQRAADTVYADTYATGHCKCLATPVHLIRGT
jgi:hypothetical protein